MDIKVLLEPDDADLGARPERYAVLDIGTNSVKFHVAERSADGGWRRVVDRAEISRLGEGLHETGEIQPAAEERTITAVQGMVDEARHDGALAIVAVATEGLRAARNAADVRAAILKRTGVPVTILSGEDESRLAFLAVKSGLGHTDGSVVVFDTGGGSTQFTFGRGDAAHERFSVPLGAVRLTEVFGLDDAVTEATLDAAMRAIAHDLARIGGRPAPDSLVGMGGAVTNLAAVRLALAAYDPDRIQGTVLERAEVERQIELYRLRPAEQRRSIVGLQPLRAGVILAGACSVRTVMDMLDKDALTVSDRGLRHGVLEVRFGGDRSSRLPDQALSPRAGPGSPGAPG